MAGDLIFQMDEGRQLKFFIQKDLAVETMELLHNQITAHGGRVETKVPIQGFILIDPRSPEGARLTGCWETSERPLRNFVAYTFVAACLQARKLIPQVFRKNGVALKLHIHPCITNENVIETLQNDIWHSGGEPLATELEADIIIADEDTPNFRAIIECFDHYHNKFVEAIPWVQKCVETGVCENTPVTKKNLGGRIPGNKRTEFTFEDDNLLASYIACRIPDPSMRGRTGNKLYHDLCSRLDLYPWANRHPWQSWRERYKNNSPRFNKLVTTYLEHHPVPESGKGLHGFVRVSSPSKSQLKQPSAVHSKSPPKVKEPGKNNAEDEGGSELSIKVGKKSPPARGKRKRSVDGGHAKESNTRKKHQVDSSRSTSDTSNIDLVLLNQEYELGRTRVDEVAESPSCIPPSRTPRARSPDSVEVERTLDNNNEDAKSDDDDDAVGHETQALLDASRAMFTNSRHPSRTPPSFPENDRPREPGNTNLLVNSHSTVANPMGAQVKLALARIAYEYRFLFDEVVEEYEELSQDLDATRSYFKEIRAFINERKRDRG